MAQPNKSLMRGVAIVAAVAGAAALMKMMKKSKHAKTVKVALHDTKEHVMAHAAKLGKFSKKSYEHVVDAVLAEYGDLKTLSKQEVKDLSKELKGSWEDAMKAMKKAKK